jgi:DNA-binding NarL/FixJ family response regulator
MTGEDGVTPIRVMLVEDDADFRRLMASLFDRQSDLEVVAQAGSLEEAGRHAASAGFDVAVLDLGLPNGDGADLIAELRRVNPGVTVLIFSASLDPASIEKATHAGADEIMDKLSSLEEVLSTVSRLGGV